MAEVRHSLVGHAAESTEARRYSGVTEADLGKGIDARNGIDWIGPEKPGKLEAIREGLASAG